MLKTAKILAGMEAINKAPSTSTVYARPSTRVELRDMLMSGVSCEVAFSVASMTAHMLIECLDCPNFTFRPSENVGWSIFEGTA